MKAFRVVHEKQTTGILLRNWLTYLLRECILEVEREAFYAPNRANIEKIRRKLNEAMALEIHIKAFRYKNENNLAFFDKKFTHAEVLCEKGEDGEYRVTDVFG